MDIVGPTSCSSICRTRHSALDQVLSATDLSASKQLVDFGQADLNTTLDVSVCWPSSGAMPDPPSRTCVAGLVPTASPALADQLIVLLLSFSGIVAVDTLPDGTGKPPAGKCTGKARTSARCG
jgi:hypothetical protein